MEYITVYTNDLSSDKGAQAKALEELKAGNAVSIGSTCIGHTRAQVVGRQGINFMRQHGAHEVQAPEELSWVEEPFFAV